MKHRFNRWELKYLVSGAQRDALADELLHHMSRDTHAGNDGSYPVTSLYYDSPDYHCFWSKVDGIRYRRKVRIRVYGRFATEADQTVMVEIKQRVNRTVQKRRIDVRLDAAYALCEHERGPDCVGPVASEIEYLVRSLALQPACVISYRREAYVGSRYERGLRVTFDRDLTCRGPEHRLGPGGEDIHFLPPDVIVMEVKADHRVPLWTTRLLARHGCVMQRMSKYCSGLARLGKVPTRHLEIAKAGASNG